MNGQINVSLANEVRDGIAAECRDLLTEVIASMLGPNGEAAGDRPLSRGDRIARFIEDAEMGALDVLKVQSNDPTFGRPTIYEAYVREFLDDIGHSPLALPPVVQPYVEDVEGVM